MHLAVLLAISISVLRLIVVAILVHSVSVVILELVVEISALVLEAASSWDHIPTSCVLIVSSESSRAHFTVVH